MRSHTAFLLLPLLLCCGCSRPGEIVGAVEADLPLPPGFALGFNHRDGSHYQSPLTGHWRNGDDLEQLIVDAIKGADTSLLVAVQELSLPSLARQLIVAHRRGVEVELVLRTATAPPGVMSNPAISPSTSGIAGTNSGTWLMPMVMTSRLRRKPDRVMPRGYCSWLGCRCWMTPRTAAVAVD